MLHKPKAKAPVHTLVYVFASDIIKELAKDQQQVAWLTKQLYNQERYYPSGYIPANDFSTMLSNWLVEMHYPTSWEVIREMTGRNAVFIG